MSFHYYSWKCIVFCASDVFEFGGRLSVFFTAGEKWQWTPVKNKHKCLLFTCTALHWSPVPFLLPCRKELTDNLPHNSKLSGAYDIFCKVKGFSLTPSEMDKIIESCGPVKSEKNMKMGGDISRIMQEKKRTLRRLILATTSSSLKKNFIIRHQHSGPSTPCWVLNCARNLGEVWNNGQG